MGLPFPNPSPSETYLLVNHMEEGGNLETTAAVHVKDVEGKESKDLLSHTGVSQGRAGLRDEAAGSLLLMTIPKN